MEELEAENRRLRQELEALADANAHAAELMAQLEETKAVLARQVHALADANARSAELMVELEEANEAGEELRIELERLHNEAVAANQSKSSFLANMSHELRTPLNAIIGYGELLEEECGEAPGNEDKIEDLRKIVGAGRHLLGLVNGILDLSKVEAGRMEVVHEDVDVPKLVHEVAATVEPLMSKRGNRLELELEEGLGMAHLDGHKVKQILLNLLSNAAKFTTDGRVLLRVRMPRGGPGRVSFSVIDSGVGMTAQQLDRVFEPFTQAERTTSRHHGGTGLGLTITRRLCELMGGTIRAESTVGEGSRFSFWLPLEPPGHRDGSAQAVGDAAH